MSGYLDRTFCPFLECVKKQCHKRLTLEVRADALKWWRSFNDNDNVQICKHKDKPNCYMNGKQAIEWLRKTMGMTD